MRHDAQVTSPESFPRQKARTRGFQLGRPRGLKVIGDRVLFIRSSSGIDPAGSLWQLDLRTQPPTEVCLVDAATLLTTGELPAAERARRERMREVTSGITHFTTNKSGTVISFAISGIAFVSVVGVTLQTRELAAPGAVIDPRVSPNGQHVAFVVDGCLWVIDAHNPDAQPQLLCESTSDTETWGLADFIAAEELDRLRGYWWLPDCSGLVVERSDTAPVEIRWISDPAQPAIEPVAHRYPAAGTANPIVELWLVPLAGTRKQLIWDLAKFPYLATVNTSDTGTVMSVLTRDQQTASINRIDLARGELIEMAVRTDPAWVDVHGELPFLASDGALIEIIADAQTDTHRITRDGVFISPAGLQVNGVVDSSTRGVLAVASPDPMEQHLYQITYDSTTTALTSGESWNNAVADGATYALATATSLSPRVEFTVVHSSGLHSISSHAQTPNVIIKPNFSFVGTTQLRTCV
ncbi:MAG: S9 family peptidase, partial [Candidatus Nanopelagicales bacterium]|nr:S9 family peptidase [Candidatus Nanopelagicales bacterium]